MAAHNRSDLVDFSPVGLSAHDFDREHHGEIVQMKTLKSLLDEVGDTGVRSKSSFVHQNNILHMHTVKVSVWGCDTIMWLK